MYIAPVFTGARVRRRSRRSASACGRRGSCRELAGLLSVSLLALGVAAAGGRPRRPHRRRAPRHQLRVRDVEPRRASWKARWSPSSSRRGTATCARRRAPAVGLRSRASCALLAFFTKASAAFFVGALGARRGRSTLALAGVPARSRALGPPNGAGRPQRPRRPRVDARPGSRRRSASSPSLFVLPHWRDYRFYNWQMSVTRKPSLRPARRCIDRVTWFPILHDMFTRMWFVLVRRRCVGASGIAGALAARAAGASACCSSGSASAALELHPARRRQRAALRLLHPGARRARGARARPRRPIAAGRGRARAAARRALLAAAGRRSTRLRPGRRRRADGVPGRDPAERAACGRLARRPGSCRGVCATWPLASRRPRLGRSRGRPAAGAARSRALVVGVATSSQFGAVGGRPDLQELRGLASSSAGALPPGTLVHGKLANGLALENRIRPIFVGRGFGNYDDRKTRDDVRYILTYIAPEPRLRARREPGHPGRARRVSGPAHHHDLRRGGNRAGHDRAALIDKFGGDPGSPRRACVRRLTSAPSRRTPTCGSAPNTTTRCSSTTAARR